MGARTSPWRRRPPTACSCACSRGAAPGTGATRPASRCSTGMPESGTRSFRGWVPGRRTATAHLLHLGVTAVELLPVHHNVPEAFLGDRGLTNYWGYNTIGYFAPHAGYSSSGDRGQQVSEFKQMVKTLHAAGIEVI